MNMIEQIKADREDGTEGPWSADLIKVAWRGGQQSLMNEAPYLSGYIMSAIVDGTVDIDARRIARVPDMEAALIAAFDALVSNIEMDDDGLTGFVPIEEINKFRSAIGAK